MRYLHLRFLRLVAMAILILGGLSAAAQADPLTTFTVTDLGPGPPTFATGANGGIVIAGNGLTAYAFQTAQDTSLNTQQLLASNFPVLQAAPPPDAPGAYGDPANVYSTFSNPITNGSGIVVAVNTAGVYGHEGNTDAYFVKQNPDGTWSTPTGMWTGGVEFQGVPTAGEASITGMNKLNEVLGVGSDGSPFGVGLPQTYLYNLNINTLLNLGTLNVLVAGGWNNIHPIAIDDQGRILLEGSENPVTGDQLEHTILLTPEGISSNPLAVPAPEPGPLALAVVTIAVLALRRAVRGRRAHGSA